MDVKVLHYIPYKDTLERNENYIQVLARSSRSSSLVIGGATRWAIGTQRACNLKLIPFPWRWTFVDFIRHNKWHTSICTWDFEWTTPSSPTDMESDVLSVIGVPQVNRQRNNPKRDRTTKVGKTRPTTRFLRGWVEIPHERYTDNRACKEAIAGPCQELVGNNEHLYWRHRTSARNYCLHSKLSVVLIFWVHRIWYVVISKNVKKVRATYSLEKSEYNIHIYYIQWPSLDLDSHPL